jgi:predicted MFS family arabinose efflux permease
MEASHASLAVAIVISGHHLGTATAQGAYPLIAEKSSWEAPFYLIGIIGCLWALLWMNLIHSNPPPYFEEEFEDTPRLGAAKQLDTSMSVSAPLSKANTPVPLNPYAASSLSPLAGNDEEPIVNDEFEPLIMSFYSSGTSGMPWFRYFTYPAVWAYFFIFFAYNWSFYLLVSYLPKFLTSILGFTMKEAGQVGLWAYLGLYVSILVGGRLNSYFIAKGYAPSLVRKVGVSLGLMPPIFLVLVITLPWFHLTVSQIAFGLLLSIAVTGFAQSSFAPNPIDLSPSSPAFIASLGNMVATLPGIFSSLFTGHVLQDIGHCQPSRSNILLSHSSAFLITDECYAAWMLIFRVCVAVYFLGWMVWLFFASGRPLTPRPSQIALQP